MKTEELATKIEEYLRDVFYEDADTLIMLNNEYCRAVNYYEDEILSIDDIDEILSDRTPWDILLLGHSGDFYPSADYFKFDGYGNIQSIYSSCALSVIDIEEIADYCAENDDDLYDGGIREILDEADEDEDEEDEDEEDEDEQEES